MSLSTTRIPPRHAMLPAILIAAGVVLVAYVFGTFGSLSLPGLALIALLGVAGLGALLWYQPKLVFVLLPTTLPLGALGPIFPLEILFVFAFGLALIRAIRDRATYLLVLHPIEAANLAFVAWAAITGFWCTDYEWYGRGLRRLMLGMASLWLAWRLPRFMSRRAFGWSLLLCGVAITLAALTKIASMGLSLHQAVGSRAEATDLGWGTANYVATLLLLLSPLLLDLALRPQTIAQRPLAWAVLLGIAIVQSVVASRAAAVLFAIGMLAQVWRFRTQRDLVLLLLVLVGVVALFASPLGQGLLFRFTDLRELGSMTVRIWYMKVAWRRIVDHFPIGIGLYQGWTYPDRLYGIDTHDYWLTVTSELGLPGLILWFLVLARIVRGIRQLGASDSRAARALGVAFTVSQLHTLVEPTFQGLQYQFLYFWVMGGSLAYGLAAATASREAPVPAATESSRR